MYGARRLVIARLQGGTALRATAATWRRFYPTGILVSSLLAGCTCWYPTVPLPPKLTEGGVQARLRLPADPHINLAARSLRPRHRSHLSQTLALNTRVEPERSAFSLADAIAFAQRESPRLRSAHAAIEGARGQARVSTRRCCARGTSSMP
jgi:hypothetical protein